MDTSGGTQSDLFTLRTGESQSSNGTLWLNKVGNGSQNPIGYSLAHAGNVLIANVSDVYNSTAREYTGIRLFASTGNVSATVAIYGLAKS